MTKGLFFLVTIKYLRQLASKIFIILTVLEVLVYNWVDPLFWDSGGCARWWKWEHMVQQTDIPESGKQRRTRPGSTVPSKGVTLNGLRNSLSLPKGVQHLPTTPLWRPSYYLRNLWSTLNIQTVIPFKIINLPLWPDQILKYSQWKDLFSNISMKGAFMKALVFNQLGLFNKVLPIGCTSYCHNSSMSFSSLVALKVP